MTKRFLFALTFIALAGSVFAKDFEKPGFTEIGVVQKITVNFTGDLNFLRKSLAVSPDTPEFGKIVIGTQVKGTRYYTPFVSKYAKNAYVDNGSFICVPKKIDKDDMISAIQSVSFYPIDYKGSYIDAAVPALCKVTGKVKYVYTGSWIIDIDPYTYNVKFRYVDEYDQAKAWLQEKLGEKEVELLNGNMILN